MCSKFHSLPVVVIKRSSHLLCTVQLVAHLGMHLCSVYNKRCTNALDDDDERYRDESLLQMVDISMLLYW